MTPLSSLNQNARRTHTKVFDAEDLLERLMDSQPLARRVLGLFAKDLPVQLAALSKALDNGELEDVKSLAHALKGSAANSGAPGVSEVAAGLERAAREGNGIAAREIFGELNAEAELASKAISAFLA